MADETQTAIDELAAQVEATETVEASAKTLIEGFAAQLAGAADDPAQVRAIAARMKASADALAAAVAANTPQA